MINRYKCHGVRKISQQHRGKRSRIEKSGVMHITLPAKMIVAIVIISGAGYLYAINDNAVSGTNIRDLEREIATLQRNNTHLKVEAAQLRSLKNVEEKTDELEMIETEEVDYIEEESPLAFR
ncbi:MAG: hypothetical protein KC736_04660 [Candidatus Moranbacteria bacterium]|nr:hypothetical protein [Candidatus Moranbacteria bacterium]